MLKVDPAGVEGGLKPLALGSSASVQVGQPAVAIGSPFGLQGSLTTGVISALGRPIQSPNGFQIRARCRPTRPSTPATPAGRCSTRRAPSSASTRRSRPSRSPTAASGSRSRSTPPSRRSRSSSAAAPSGAPTSASRRRARPTAAGRRSPRSSAAAPRRRPGCAPATASRRSAVRPSRRRRRRRADRDPQARGRRRGGRPARRRQRDHEGQARHPAEDRDPGLGRLERPAGRLGRRRVLARVPIVSRARNSSASSGLSFARWTTRSRSDIEETSSTCSLMNHCMNCSQV